MGKVLTRAGLVVLALGAGAPAFGFQLGDHARVTRVAFTEAAACLPELKQDFSDFQEDLVVGGVLDEDLNLIRKWVRYSHYYNPYKKLNMRRVDGSVSVIETEATLNDDPGARRSDRGYLLLGRAIHYIQDAAVPAHVVPVAHGLDDGFESYSVGLAPDSDCSWVTAAQDPQQTLLSIFRANAIDTYERVMDGSVSYRGAEGLGRGSWAQLFWTPGTGPDFGRYGTMGNRFGDAATGVESGVFDRFKQGQLELAVDGTRKALLWYERLIRE